MFETVLIANRGEIACRIARTLGRLGIRSVAVCSEPDRHSRHALAADRAICIGPAAPEQSYLNAAALIDAARISGARAIHPGYGFLSENADFAERVEALGIAFIGPTPEQIRAFALPERARELAREVGIPLLPDGSAAVEHYVARARRIEVSILGDGQGGVIALGERDGSAQSRGRTLIAETPAPNLGRDARDALARAAVALGRAIGYRSAGAVEFVYDTARKEFYFLALSPRLSIGHAVTEAVHGVDLVEWMIRIAAGESPDLGAAGRAPSGHAIEVRVCAEDPARDFKPSAGLVTEAAFPSGARVDAWIERGTDVPAVHDPLLAKLVVHGADRDRALGALGAALEATRIGGIETNLGYLRELVQDPVFASGELTTQSLTSFTFRSASVEVTAPGTFSIVVDHPGRIGYWDVGIPPSGPMDALAHRLANRAVGNPEPCASLELTLSGPALEFATDALIALAGAEMEALLDGDAVPLYRPTRVRAGQRLKLGAIQGPGCRAYLAVRGGFVVPDYLGSKTTFTLGGFGGHAGRPLRRGDVLHIGDDAALGAPARVPEELVPRLERRWEIGVLYGPHGAPDFFTPSDIETLFATDWEVHYQSNRTGVRLIGPKPEWARPDGGEAGLHPSNIHDVAYAIGAIDFTGDMPILLGPDGPSLGGFVCPATVVRAELWKLGQLRPGDRVRFVPIEPERAEALFEATERAIATLDADAPRPALEAVAPRGAVIHELPATAERVRVVYRRSGDENLLVEYGPLELDLRLRLRVHALMTWLADSRLPGILELTPGIRSLQIHFDPARLSSARLLDTLRAAERELPAGDDVDVPSRVVHLPLSWDDPATRLAIGKYTQSVRPDAPWCPSNIEFIRRINGLDSIEDVHRIVFESSYLVLGLGDVYLGAPVATPIDPRQRLVTTKYNPARTWTPENAVGIGGAYLCIYGMEGPGGYQFVGRTLQVYNRFRSTPEFRDDKPWLLDFFDQIRFHPVSAETLLEMREAFPHGRAPIRLETTRFRLRDYERSLRENADGIAAFKRRQQAAFDAERRRWVASGQLGGTGAERGDAFRGSEGRAATPGPRATELSTEAP